MSAELLSELEELRRLAACGFHPQAAVRAADLVSRTIVAPVGTPMRAIGAEAMAIGVRSKGGLWREPEEKAIDELLLEVERSTGFGSSLHLYVLLTYLDVGWGAEARCRLLDALLAEAPVEAQDDRVDAVRFRRRLMRQLPADADWLASVRDGSVPFEGHASFNEWERRVLAGEHRPTWHWMGAALDHLESAGDRTSRRMRFGAIFPFSDRIAKSNPLDRAAQIARTCCGDSPIGDVLRALSLLDDFAKCASFVCGCAERWSGWFGADSLSFSEFVVIFLGWQRHGPVEDPSTRLTPEQLSLFKRAQLVSDVKVRVAPSDDALAWERSLKQRASEQARARGHAPHFDDAACGLNPWNAGLFRRSLAGRPPSLMDGRQEYLGRGVLAIVSGEHWADLSEWHLQFRDCGGVSGSDLKTRAWIRRAALGCFEKGKFGIGVRLLSIAGHFNDLDSLIETDPHVTAGIDDRSCPSIVAEMTALVQRVPFSESASEFLTELSHASFMAGRLEDSELLIEVAIAAVERCSGLSETDRSRVFRWLLRPDALVEGSALIERVQSLRRRFRASFGVEPHTAIEALRLELHFTPQYLPEPDSTYRQEITSVLCEHPEWRAELARLLDSYSLFSVPVPSGVDRSLTLVRWTDLLVQVAIWQREAGVSRWVRERNVAVPAVPASGLLDLTRIADVEVDAEDFKEALRPSSRTEDESSADLAWEPGVALMLFLALIASPSEPSRTQGWRSVPAHGGNSVLPNPARELFDEFLDTVSVGSIDWDTIVFHEGLPVSYRIEALRRAQDRRSTSRTLPTTTARKRLSAAQYKSLQWDPRESYVDVLLRALIETGQFEEARQRSAGGPPIPWVPADWPRMYRALLAELAVCEDSELAIGWLRWYGQHWRGWLERNAKKALRMSSTDHGVTAGGGALDQNWSRAAHGLAFVGFELRRRVDVSSQLEGLDCILRAEFAFRLAWLDDAKVSWWSLRSGPAAESAAWTRASGENPHRVSRLAIDGLVRDQSPGSADWACAIGVGLSFARWHRDDSHCGKLLALLASWEFELDAVERQRAEARGDSSPFLTAESIDYWIHDTSESLETR